MITPGPGVLDRLIQDHQRELREQAITPARSNLRVSIGHLLIAAGSALSGERVERYPRRRALTKTA